MKRDPDESPIWAGPVDRVSASLTALGLGLLFIGIAVLVLGRIGTAPGIDDGLEARFRVALIAAGAALVSVGFGAARLVSRLPADKMPAAWQSVATIVVGFVGLVLSGSVFDWPLHYLPSDGRSQPANVLAGALFFGWFAAFPMIFGAVSLFALARAKRRSLRPSDIQQR
jgi:hypothetical protein